MSKLIPMACLALLGTGGHAWADQATTGPTATSNQQTSGPNKRLAAGHPL